MADSASLRNKRARWHKAGNHELCRDCGAKGRSEGQEGPVSAAHRVELEAMGLLDGPEGQVALALARLLDEQKGAMGAAATASRLLALMGELRKRRPAQSTPFDEIAQRRARRGA
jgi:hypothetical protein